MLLLLLLLVQVLVVVVVQVLVVQALGLVPVEIESTMPYIAPPSHLPTRAWAMGPRRRLCRLPLLCAAAAAGGAPSGVASATARTRVGGRAGGAHPGLCRVTQGGGGKERSRGRRGCPASPPNSSTRAPKPG